MTDCTPISSELRTSLAKATDSANQWRGRCINLFARAEWAIGTTLATKESGKKPPMLVSQKAKRVAAHLTSTETCQCLDEFVAFLADRTALTHGTGKLWVDEGGSWLLTLEWAGGTGPVRRVFASIEAEAFHKELRTVVQRLERRLRTA